MTVLKNYCNKTMLENVHFDEAKQSQLPAVEMLVNLGWTYISRDEVLRERKGDTRNFILRDIAAAKLMELNSYEVDGTDYKFSEKDVLDAIDELEHLPYEGLNDTAQKVYNMIMPTSGGKTIKVNAGGRIVSKNFRFIDFKNIENNAFHVTVEYEATGKDTIRPDIVCFVNGIPFAVIENKKTSVKIDDAVNQMNRNQGPDYCPRLYTYTQLLAASNVSEFRYGTTGTPTKFYAIWKERPMNEEEIEQEVLAVMGRTIKDAVYQQILTDLNGYTRHAIQHTARKVTEQDKGIVFLFAPKRLLDLTKNYILFDAGVKKLARYQQYFAIRKMLSRVDEIETISSGITRRKGGLIWHTQGSGKSLTMVMFVKALIEDPDIVNPRVIIVTDRRDLDRQIRDTFKNCGLKKEVIQATSGQHLIDLIKGKNLAVITTLVQKFKAAQSKYTDPDRSQDIFVLIDEAHRTQGGEANLEMTRAIPNACYIGFTGTPLMTSEKESWRKFGGYIDKYTIDDALGDKIILPLIYEGRYVPLQQNAEQIDRHVERSLGSVSKSSKAHRLITSRAIEENPHRIEEIAHNIQDHFTKIFKGTGLKGQVVAPSKFAAVLLHKFFEKNGKIQTAVIISDEHDTGDETDAHKKEVVEYLDKIQAGYSSLAKYEKDVIDSFKNYSDGVEVIIVVDKLMTGFDAPRNTVLYLCKDLKDHNLLQAIARVNRLFDNQNFPKMEGYIIDYSENARNIKSAMKLFGNYDADDVKGALIDLSEKKEELVRAYVCLTDLFKGVAGSSDSQEYIKILADEPKRMQFNQALTEFTKVFSECCVLQYFATTFQPFDAYRKDLKGFTELRRTASLAYEGKSDLSEYKKLLINILDEYINAREVESLTKPVLITNRKLLDQSVSALDSDSSRAEAIASQMNRTITEKYKEKDDALFERFSNRVNEILIEMRQGKLADAEALKQLKLLNDDVLNKKDADLPAEITAHKGSDIFYRNLREEFASYKLGEANYIGIVLGLFAVIKKEAIVDWYKNPDVIRRMKNSLDDYLYDSVKTGKGIDLSPEKIRQTIERSIQLAEANAEIFA